MFHHFLQSAVQTIDRIQVVNLVVIRVGTQEHICTVLRFYQLVICSGSIALEDAAFRNPGTNRIFNVIGTGLCIERVSSMNSVHFSVLWWE